MNIAEQLTVISFDETYVSSRICLDKKNERVIVFKLLYSSRYVKSVILVLLRQKVFIYL